VFDLDEWWLFALLAAAVSLGAWSVWRVRVGRDPRGTAWARRAFLASLFALGGGNLIALTCATHCLVPYGLAAGWLVIAMLWENPFRVWQEG
jgi:hypothetical protein